MRSAQTAAVAGLFVLIVGRCVAAQAIDELGTRCRDSDPAAAIPACTALVDSGQEIPRNRPGSARFYRGTSFLKRKEFARAIADLDEAAKLNPINSSAFLNRGAAYAQMGQHDRAIQKWRRG